MAEICSVNAHTWRIEEGGVRFFLLEGTEKALLIDSGMRTRDAREIAGKLTDKPLEMLYTHADPDHVGSHAQFEQFYMHPAEGCNYYSDSERGGEMVPVADGDVLELGDRPLRVLYIPGHTPGSIAILDGKYRALFSGDSVQDSNIFMFGPYRDLHSFILSLKKLETVTAAFDVIYPSHGTAEKEPDQIRRVREGAEKLLRGELEGHPVEMFGGKVRLYKTEAAGFLYP